MESRELVAVEAVAGSEYQAPQIESVMHSDEIDREVLYAGLITRE